MSAASSVISELTMIVLQLCWLGIGLMLLLFILAIFAAPFIYAYKDYVEDKETQDRFDALAKESDERMRKVRADMAESEAKFRKLTEGL